MTSPHLVYKRNTRNQMVTVYLQGIVFTSKLMVGHIPRQCSELSCRSTCTYCTHCPYHFSSGELDTEAQMVNIWTAPH